MIDALGSPQTVLVLGGSSDIGLATARRLVRARARTVYLALRSTERAGPAVAGLQALGATTVEAVRFDADDTGSHAAFVEDLFGRGDIDVVVLAFGRLGDQLAAEKDPMAGVEVARTNYLGAVSVGLAVGDRLRRQGHGTLVVLSSVAGERPRRSNFVYGSSKAGLDSFATGLGDALVGSGARVLVVRPGFVVTKMTAGMDPVPFSTTPEKVADAIADALAGGAETIWVPGILRVVMSALRHVPRAVFRRLPV